MRRNLFWRAVLICAIFVGGVWLAFFGLGKADAAFHAGTVLGAAVAFGSLVLFFKAWVSAPRGADVALWYGARVALIFGSIVAALFVPWVSALGVLLPQLFPAPVLAVLMALDKRQ